MSNLIFIRLGRMLRYRLPVGAYFNTPLRKLHLHAVIACSVISSVLLTSCSDKIQKAFLQDAPYQADAKLSSICTNFMHYAPDTSYPSHTPMRYVRVNFHVMRDSAATVNFDETEGPEFIRGLIADANHRLRNNQKMTLPVGNNTAALPIGYQYVLTPDPSIPDDDGIYFHYDDEFAFFNKKKNTFDLRMFDKYHVQRGSVLNVFLLEHPPDSIKSPTYKSSNDGIGLSEWVKVAGLKQHSYHTVYNEDGTTTINGPYYNAHILQHEIGHSLGLAHTWNTNDGCDDTPQNPGCWDGNSTPCKETGIHSNNLMDYNNCQCALSPCQIAKIHYNFSREKSSQRKLLLPVWCEYKPEASIQIGWPHKVVWNSSKDLEGDIVVNNGGELTIQCEVSLPKGAKIIVKPKGRLILDGARITNKCGDNWEGIEVWETGKQKGEVVYVNPSAFEHVNREPVQQPDSPGK